MGAAAANSASGAGDSCAGGGGGTKKEKGRRGPARVVPTHVHQVYKLRCCAAAPAHSLLAAGATWQAAKWRASRGSLATAARPSAKKVRTCAGTCAAPMASTAIGAAHSATWSFAVRGTWGATAPPRGTPAPPWGAQMMTCCARCPSHSRLMSGRMQASQWRRWRC